MNVVITHVIPIVRMRSTLPKNVATESGVVPLAYEPLEPLRLSDVGLTGDNADTVIDAERVTHEVLPNKMAAAMFSKMLWGSSFEAWAEFNARISPYFARFSDIVVRFTSPRDGVIEGEAPALPLEVIDI